LLTFDHVKWTNGSLGDSFDVKAQKDGQSTWELLRRLGYDNFPNYAPGCGDLQDLHWQKQAVDLAAYKGQWVTLRFSNVTRQNGEYNTWTYLDEVRIEP
jgi:hypothetical protein